MDRDPTRNRNRGDRAQPLADQGHLLLRLLAATAPDDGTLVLQLLGAAVENSTDAVVVSISDLHDPGALQIVYVNPALETLVAEKAAALGGRDPLLVVGGLLDRQSRAALLDATRERTTLTLERARIPRRRRSTFELRAVPIFQPSGPLTEWVWTIRDITDSVRQELGRQETLRNALSERTASLESAREELRIMQHLAPLATLAAGLAHDMNNLLLPMRAHLDCLATAGLAKDTLEHVGSLQSAVQYLRQLSESLRLFALDPDQPVTPEGATDLGSWWKETQPLLSSTTRPPIMLEIDLPPDLPPVALPPQLMTLAVLNLFGNAAEAIDGKGTVRFWARLGEDGTSVQVGVTDDGRGMPPAVRRRAFDPFFSTKRRKHGTGLGLALVHGLVRAAGGLVRIDSRVRRGTTVTLTLPIAPPATPSTHGKETSGTALIRVSNGRVAACFRSMLGATGIAVDPDPARCSVLVTEPTHAALEEARQLRARKPHAVIIAYGSGDPEWKRLGAAFIEEGAGPSTIRDALSRLVVKVPEGSSR